jgi:hypothetical protein
MAQTNRTVAISLDLDGLSAAPGKPARPKKARLDRGHQGPSFYDSAFWLDTTNPRLRIDEIWIEALLSVDQHGDKGPLLTLLRSTRTLQPGILVYLADLVDRYVFKRTKHAVKAKPKAQLIDAMQSGKLVKSARLALIELLASHDLKLPRGRPRVPAYNYTDRNIKLLLAIEHIVACRKQGMTVNASITEAAEIYEINDDEGKIWLASNDGAKSWLASHYRSGHDMASHRPKKGGELHQKFTKIKTPKLKKPLCRSDL